jgi:hypothetical protein
MSGFNGRSGVVIAPAADSRKRHQGEKRSQPHEL